MNEWMNQLHSGFFSCNFYSTLPSSVAFASLRVFKKIADVKCFNLNVLHWCSFYWQKRSCVRALETMCISSTKVGWKPATLLVCVDVTPTRERSVTVTRCTRSVIKVSSRRWHPPGCGPELQNSSEFRRVQVSRSTTRGMSSRWLLFTCGCNVASWLMQRILHNAVVNQSFFGGFHDHISLSGW